MFLSFHPLKRIALLAATLVAAQTGIAQNAATPGASTPTASPMSGTWSITADYFGYKSEWAGVQYALQAFPTYTYTGEDKRDGNMYGGTLSGSFGRFAVDFSYREGNASLELLNRSALGAVYFDTVEFADKFYEGRVRFNLGNVGGFRGYLAMGLARQELDYDYFVQQYDFPRPRAAILGLSGDAAATFLTIGYGITRSYQLEPTLFFFPKLEGTLLAGQQDEGYKQTVLNRSISDYIYGAEASLTGRFAWKTSETSAFSIELGGKSRYLSSDSVFGGLSWGYFARAAIQFSY